MSWPKAGLEKINKSQDLEKICKVLSQNDKDFTNLVTTCWLT